MDAEISEGLFATYLDKYEMAYTRHYRVSGDKNVDFMIEFPSVVFCDVKEVRDSSSDFGSKIDAYEHIRDDICKLRKKFKNVKPQEPVVLVTMNFSSSFFTAFTVAQAMLGDVGFAISNGNRGDARHLPRGNAAVTKNGNTAISGVLVFDANSGNHRYLSNPFSSYPVPNGFFPEIREI
ncbi:MAG: hypothetical protein BVN35_16285 [Proteobacteria bacterium ST_bin11]|nr:MAG: hypothetical protein BVN35_16285 [Proteobacteria bacterium ST_bin11]